MLDEKTELDFQNARVETLPDEVFECCQSLVTLGLRCNKLVSLGSLLHAPGSTTQYPNLESLDLYENRLVEASFFLDFQPIQSHSESVGDNRSQQVIDDGCTSDHEDCAHEAAINLEHHHTALNAHQVDSPGLLPPQLT